MVYEVEFRSGNKKYEYEIDANNGQVVKYESETSGSAANTGTGSNTSSYIGESAAKTAALNHAGVKESSTQYCYAWLEYDDGRPECYEVEFVVGSTRYEYEIALTSATVIKSEVKTYSQSSSTGSGSTGNSGATSTNTGSSNTGSTTTSGGGTSSDIGSDAAKAAALKDAGVQESAATGMKVKRDYDDGRWEYEVEFWSGNTEYDYTIDAVSGAIRKKDVESHGSANTGSSGSSTTSSGSGTSTSTGTTSDIGSESAKTIALNHAGVSASDAYQMKVEQDYDHGRLEYEIEFKANGMEYEYTVDAANGTILSHESDRDD